MVRIEGLLGAFDATVTGRGFRLSPRTRTARRLEVTLNAAYPPGITGPGLRRYAYNVEARAAWAVQDYGGEIVEVAPPDDDVELPPGAVE